MIKLRVELNILGSIYILILCGCLLFYRKGEAGGNNLLIRPGAGKTSEMSETSNSVFYKSFDPVLQAAIVLGLGLIVMIGGKIIAMTDLLPVSERFPWTIAAAFILFFAMFNSIFSLSTKDMNKYWSRSVLSYAGLVLGSGTLAYIFSSIPIGDAGSYRWIIMVLTFAYLVFLSIMRFMKRIVEFAEKEEWNRPKPRKRRK